ncbi:MAG: hypothetical protein JXQ90_02500 [Cyclobacteriaceae bacterium]
MRTAFTIIAVLLGLAVLGQPSFQTYNFSVQTGEKDKYYEKQAKRNFEGTADDMNAPAEYLSNTGILFAAHGLRIAEKKGVISGLQELLTNNYSFTVDNTLDLIEDLKVQSASFEGDETVTIKAKIVNYYNVMNKYSKILAGLPPAKFKPVKKKDPGLDIEIGDYKSGLEAAETALDEAIEAAASMHYAKGRELSRSQSLEDSKEAARRFSYALDYINDYRDAADRYENARKLGTTRLGITEFESSGSSEFGNIGYSISNYLLDEFSGRDDEFEFFEVLDRDALETVLREQKLSLSGLMDESTTAELGEIPGINAILVGRVVQSYVEREKLDPVKENFSKEVKVGEEKYTDDKGKERTRDVKETVKVVANKHTKTSLAVATINFKIVDISTGRRIAGDEITERARWRDSWYTLVSGDKRAMPSRRTEVQFIPKADLMDDALSDIKQTLYNHIAAYGRDVSR